jgi:hypothetical protein
LKFLKGRAKGTSRDREAKDGRILQRGVDRIRFDGRVLGGGDDGRPALRGVDRRERADDRANDEPWRSRSAAALLTVFSSLHERLRIGAA